MHATNLMASERQAEIIQSVVVTEDTREGRATSATKTKLVVYYRRLQTMAPGANGNGALGGAGNDYRKGVEGARGISMGDVDIETLSYHCSSGIMVPGGTAARRLKVGTMGDSVGRQRFREFGFSVETARARTAVLPFAGKQPCVARSWVAYAG